MGVKNSVNKNSMSLINSREHSGKKKLEKWKIRSKTYLRRRQEGAQQNYNIKQEEGEEEKCQFPEAEMQMRNQLVKWLTISNSKN